MTGSSAGQFIRLGETGRAPVEIRIDGESVSCLNGDTLLTAMLLHGRHLRHSEFGDGPRAGFCSANALRCYRREVRSVQSANQRSTFDITAVVGSYR